MKELKNEKGKARAGSMAIYIPSTPNTSLYNTVVVLFVV